MKILVAGAKGQVGTSLLQLGQKLGYDMLGMSSHELDVTSIRNVDAVVSQVKPDLIINASAYTAVDKAESDLQRAYEINETGPKLLAMACRKLDIPFFHISTDYVFDGDSDRSYRVEDPVNPQSVYGRSKSMGELAVRNTLPKHIILRTSWVFSSTGNNFVKTISKLSAERDELKVVNDQCGGPTSADAIADVLLSLAEKVKQDESVPWGLHHFSQQPFVTWFEFAQAIIETRKELGLHVQSKLLPCTSDEYPAVAKRPMNSRMVSSLKSAKSEWKSDLTECLKKSK